MGGSGLSPIFSISTNCGLCGLLAPFELFGVFTPWRMFTHRAEMPKPIGVQRLFKRRDERTKRAAWYASLLEPLRCKSTG